MKYIFGILIVFGLSNCQPDTTVDDKKTSYENKKVTKIKQDTTIDLWKLATDTTFIQRYFHLPSYCFLNKPAKSKPWGLYSVLNKKVLPILTERLTDTTFLDFEYTRCKTQKLRVGDMAFILIDRTEHAPYALFTHSQWCTREKCGEGYDLPHFFLDFLESDRERFKELYKTYYKSKERREYLNRL